MRPGSAAPRTSRTTEKSLRDFVAGGQKKLAGTEVPAKFEQGGFTSGRRKGPQTLFPGTSPGNPDRR